MDQRQIEAALADAADLIRTTARTLARRPGFSLGDQDDLAQQLRTRLLASLPTFNSSLLPLPAFTRMVIGRAARSLLRDRRSHARRDGAAASLPRRVGDADGGATSLADEVHQGHLDARHGVVRRSEQEQADLHRDFAAFLADLPADERVVAEALLREGTVVDAARSLGLSRGAVRTALRRWRARARRLGLEEYLGNPQPRGGGAGK
jgi:RNA polymerase sigma factor (sigma-70 family)